ncbi:imidazolonepropionase-like amidohydrolase [Nitrobacteraceae bacterium AZCC 2161]
MPETKRSRSSGLDRRRLLQAGVALATAGVSRPALAAVSEPDRILLGRILTFDGNDSIAEALAIKDGTIIGSGARADVMALRGPSTRVHDLGARTVMPGFNDVHAHLEREGLKLEWPSLAGLHDRGSDRPDRGPRAAGHARRVDRHDADR